MVTNRRSAAGMVVLWLTAVAGVSATAWVAIDKAGRDITTVSVSTLPHVPLNTPTIAIQPTKTATPTKPSATSRPTAAHPRPTAPAATPTPAPPVPAPAPAPATATPQDLTTRVAGGLVSVRCTGPAIELLSAQPENDWRMHVDTFGGGQILLTFQKGEEEDTRTTTVTAVCQSGAPVFSVGNT